jgi:hypothetical protein
VDSHHRSHARLRYRDTITAQGALDDAMAGTGLTIAGVPGFLYREWALHARAWATKVSRGLWDEAFLDECRLRYLSSYMTSKWREALGRAFRGMVQSPPHRAQTRASDGRGFEE